MKVIFLLLGLKVMVSGITEPYSFVYVKNSDNVIYSDSLGNYEIFINKGDTVMISNHKNIYY